jgi:hypothetical protein
MKIGACIFATLAMVSSYANAAEFTVGYAEVRFPLGRILFFESREGYFVFTLCSDVFQRLLFEMFMP